MIGAKTYNIPQPALELIAFLDWMITIIFLVEIIIRYLGEKEKRYFFRQGWNVFDALIVVVSLIPIENSEMAFIGRLVRVFRVLRMVSIIPELRSLVNSLIKALPQLGYVMLMMFIIFYIYGAMGSILFSKVNPVLWGDVGISMLTLFRVMTFEDWTDVMYETMHVYPLSWTYYLSFIFFSAFAFLNMVIGIMVKSLEEEQQQENIKLEDISQEIHDLKDMISQLQKDLPKN
jgi:voltage-gated sodium channel